MSITIEEPPPAPEQPDPPETFEIVISCIGPDGQSFDRIYETDDPKLAEAFRRFIDLARDRLDGDDKDITPELLDQIIDQNFPGLSYIRDETDGLTVKESEINEVLAGDILNLDHEARVHIDMARRTEAGVWRSGAFETTSNALFVAVALYTAKPGFLEPLLSAALVYVPLSYDLATARFRKRDLNRRLRIYERTNNPEVFDGAGLTLQGKFNEEAHGKHHWAVAPLVDIARLFPRPFHNFKNPYSYGLIGSVPRYIYVNAFQIAKTGRTLCALAKETLRSRFGRKARPQENRTIEPIETIEIPPYGESTGPGHKIIRTELASVKNVSVVQMPANPHRLKRSLTSTIRGIFNDHAKAVLNAVGVFGIAEFCWFTGHEVLNSVQTSLHNPSLENIIVSTTWGLVTISGAAAAQHFLEDREVIHTELNSKQAYAALKYRTTIQLRDIIETLKEKMAELQAVQKEGAEEQGEIIEEILELYHNIDPGSLDEDTQAALLEIYTGQAHQDDLQAAPG